MDIGIIASFALLFVAVDKIATGWHAAAVCAAVYLLMPFHPRERS